MAPRKALLSNINWRDCEIFLESPLADGRCRAFVCIDPHRQQGSVRSRFVWRLDLPGTYASRREAKTDANELIGRFFRGHMGARSFEVSIDVHGYRITGKSRFRGDIHEWEPWLEVTDIRQPKRHLKLEGLDAIFCRNTFRSCETAARFALSYGERLVLGMVSGLKS